MAKVKFTEEELEDFLLDLKNLRANIDVSTNPHFQELSKARILNFEIPVPGLYVNWFYNIFGKKWIEFRIKPRLEKFIGTSFESKADLIGFFKN